MPERLEDMASTLEMALMYTGGAGATPRQHRQAAAVLAKTPLSLLSAARFERRDERSGGGEFLLQACAVSKVRF